MPMIDPMIRHPQDAQPLDLRTYMNSRQSRFTQNPVRPKLNSQKTETRQPKPFGISYYNLQTIFENETSGLIQATKIIAFIRLTTTDMHESD